MNNLTLRQLRAFRAVTEAGSFSAAAEALHLTPAALSGQIKELEAQLGVKLFDRNTRKVSLSVVGREFFPLTERVLQDLDDAVTSISSLKAKRRGVVRLAAPEVVSCTLVPAAMAVFREQYPQVEVRFLDVPLEEVVQRTMRGEVDLGIAPGHIEQSDIDRTPFMEAPLHLAVRRDDPLATRRQVGWEQLRKRRLISFFREFARWAAPQFDSRADDLFPTDIVVVRRINTALAMVQARFGITLCPAFANGLASGFDLVLVPLAGPSIVREYAVLQRAGHSLTPAAEAFRAFLLGFAPQWTANGNGLPMSSGRRRGRPRSARGSREPA
ncbi:MAG: LysR family transcriptional regulator [Burkholderiaceae bacterium]